MCAQGGLTEKDYDVLKFLPNNKEKNEGKLTLSRRRFLFTTRISLLNKEIDKENKRSYIAEEKMSTRWKDPSYSILIPLPMHKRSSHH